MDEDAWEWSDKIQKKLHPRRGGVAAKSRKVMKPRKAFKGLGDAFALHRSKRSAEARDGAAFDRLRAPLGKGAPAILSPDEEAAMVRHFFTMAFGPEMVDYWMGAESAAFALEVLLATHNLSNYNERGWYKQTHCVQTAWERLRQRLALAEVAEYEAALELAHALWAKASFHARLGLAYTFPAEPQWAHEVADAYAKCPERWGAKFLYHSVIDPERMSALFDQGVWWEPGIFFSFVEGARLHADEALVPLLDQERSTPHRKNVYEALAIIPSDAAMYSLVERIDDRAAIPFLMDAAMRWPTRAERLVSKALSAKKSATLSSLLSAVHNALL